MSNIHDRFAPKFEESNSLSPALAAAIERAGGLDKLEDLMKIPEYPQINLPDIGSFEDHNSARQFHRRLVELIADFESEIDETTEVGVRLTNSSNSITIHISSLGYWNPSLIIYYGRTETNSPTTVIQHVSQIDIALVKVQRLDPSKPRQPIGFCSKELIK